MASRVPRLSDNNKKTNSLYYLKKAKQSCVQNNYAKAYEYFVHYFESLNDPSEATSAVKTVFTKLVCKIGTVLEETDNVEELLKCYIQAINLFPNNYVILNNLGAYMFKVGEIDIARRYLELAVKANKNYLPAEKNLMHLKWHELPRWHFRMLNDKPRNSAYEKAILSLIYKGYKNVIDIGAGCGLLSLIASRDPEVEVMAIEENKILAKMCTNILKSNNVENVKVVNCYSTDITEPPDKCNLLVTETFDVALFGERALESIFHALTVLRTEDDFKIIPCGAKVYVAAINSDVLLSRHQYIHCPSLDILNIGKTCIKQYEAEPYDAEYLSEKNFKFVSDIQQIFDLNFGDSNQIYQVLNTQNVKNLVNLTCKEGMVHALAVWFDLYLTEDIVISTNPCNQESVKCWEQAVIYLEHPINMKEGEPLPLTVSLNNCKLSVTANRQENNHECFIVSKEIITLLNDDKLIECLIALADKFSNSILTVVDFNVFPLVGLLLAKNGCSVYHVIKNDRDRQFFERLLTLNNIPLEKFTILHEDVPLEMDVQNQQSLFLFDVINVDGSLENSFFKKKSEIISSIHVPKMIKINVQLVFSAYIDYCNKVDDNNVLGFKIATYINEYTGYEHPNLDNFNYQILSDVISFKLDKDGEKSSPITVNKSGLVNCLYSWYDVQFYEDIIFSTKDSSHFKKSCFFLDELKQVSAGDIFNVRMQTDTSYIKFSLQ